MIEKLSKNLIPLAIVVAGFLVAGAFVYIDQDKMTVLSPQEAAEKALAFINQSIEEDVRASLLGVVEEGDFYKISLKIEENEYQSYITKDGKYLFPSGFNLEAEVQELPEEQPAEELPPLDSFAQCLTEKGAKFYGSQYCGWCKKQKELFGNSLQYITYIECVDSQTDQWSEVCREAGIEAIPTWEFNGERSPGFRTLEELAELSGCSL